MRFPTWTEQGRSRNTRARNRLRYILSHLALQLGPRGSMVVLGKHIGVDQSTLSLHIKDGACSERTAALIVSKLGDGFVKAHELTDPLGIPSDN